MAVNTFVVLIFLILVFFVKNMVVLTAFGFILVLPVIFLNMMIIIMNTVVNCRINF